MAVLLLVIEAQILEDCERAQICLTYIKYNMFDCNNVIRGDWYGMSGSRHINRMCGQLKRSFMTPSISREEIVKDLRHNRKEAAEVVICAG